MCFPILHEHNDDKNGCPAGFINLKDMNNRFFIHLNGRFCYFVNAIFLQLHYFGIANFQIPYDLQPDVKT